jgi:hypothetical protein
MPGEGGATTTNPVSRQRPKTSSAYLTASALNNAGFKGWPLVVMTALAGRESKWNPTALNNNPATGDYSVGLYQINYYGDLLKGRTAEYGSPQTLLSNPQDQANAVYKLAGGNNLSNLQPWALTSSPASGVTPVGSTASVGQNTLAPYMASATAAAAEVGTFGPAPASQIAQANAWPGASPIGSALSNGGNTSVQEAQAATQAAANASGSGCSSKGNVFGTGGVAGVGSFTFTYCELKALLGGLSIAAGGIIMVIGLTSLIVGGLGSKGVKGAVAPTVIVARFAGSTARKTRRTPSGESEPSAPKETQRQKEDRVYAEMQAEKEAA